jgi:hypothetical protein
LDRGSRENAKTLDAIAQKRAGFNSLADTWAGHHGRDVRGAFARACSNARECGAGLAHSPTRAGIGNAAVASSASPVVAGAEYRPGTSDALGLVAVTMRSARCGRRGAAPGRPGIAPCYGGAFCHSSDSILGYHVATYGLAMRSILWVVRFVFWIIVCAAFGVTLLVVHPVWWMVRAVAQLGKGAHNIPSSRAGSAAAISHGTAGQRASSAPVPLIRRPSFPDVAISVRQASEALFAYEQRAFRARSEIRQTAARTLETIAQTQALMAQLDAVSATMGLREMSECGIDPSNTPRRKIF